MAQDTTKSGSCVDWRHVIQIVENSSGEEDVFTFDTLSRQEVFKSIPNVPLNVWFGQSEKNQQGLAELGIDVFAWEGHRALMGDLTPLVVMKNGTDIDLEGTRRRWRNLQTLSACIENDSASPDFNPEVANWYRLFRVLEGIVSIGHQPVESCRMLLFKSLGLS